jgi:1,4-alpha-glucan branching enzyme
MFNFHPFKSFPNYRIGIRRLGTYRIIFSTERVEYGGHNRIDESVNHISEELMHNHCPYSLLVKLVNVGVSSK